MTEPETLRAAVAGCDTVVNLVAIIAGKPSAFERVIAQGTRELLSAAQAAGATRWVQMSALGTSRETKDLVPYYRAKWEAEEAVRASGLPHVILRPSFVFGPDGGALPRFARIARLAPVTPIIGSGTQRLQPIWVDDVAEIVARCAEGAESGLLQFGGPEIVDWNEFWDRLKAVLGTRRPALHLPFWFMRPQAFVLERLPNPPLTRDQLTMLAGGDNVAEPNDSSRFEPNSSSYRSTSSSAAPSSSKTSIRPRRRPLRKGLRPHPGRPGFREARRSSRVGRHPAARLKSASIWATCVSDAARELLEPCFGDHCVDDPAVAVAGRPLDEAGPFEPVQESRDPRRGQQHLIREVDAAHPPVGRARQTQKHFVVVDRQPVVDQ